MSIKRYDFQDMMQGDAAAGEIYTKLNDLGFKTAFENTEGHGHQIYRVFSKDAQSLESGSEIMRFEYNGTVEPATLRFDFGTSMHRLMFQGLAEIVTDKFGGIEVPEIGRK